MNKRLIVFAALFGLLNISFVPLLSLYGLRVCPVLSIPGFAFGCIYTGLYVATVNILNIFLISIIKFNFKEFDFFIRLLKVRRFLVFPIIYIIASLVGVVAAKYLLAQQGIEAHSRAPQILLLSSLLLGITQAYGLNWATQNLELEEVYSTHSNFKFLWASQIFRIILPLITIVLVLLHFFSSQSSELTKSHLAPAVGTDQTLLYSSYVVLFLLSWFLLTFLFYFMSEYDYMKSVNVHFDKLKKLDTNHRTKLNQAWGLWAAIISQLNEFTKILSERTRLLNSFSKFVTQQVAEQALQQDLKRGYGIKKELTVIMIDIRDFTSISEKYKAEEVVLLLNEYFNAVLGVIVKFQISVDKFIGDGILAYVDVDEKTTSAALQNQLAVQASLAILAELNGINLNLKSLKLPEVKIGIGIYRGELIIGLIGSESKLQHTIIGDTVNRTSRLEGISKELEASVVISAEVWKDLKPDQQLVFTYRGGQQVKGVKEKIEVYAKPV